MKSDMAYKVLICDNKGNQIGMSFGYEYLINKSLSEQDKAQEWNRVKKRRYHSKSIR